MFGLTEFEMEMYRNNTQDFAVREVTPRIMSNSKCIAPILMQGDKLLPDMGFVNQLMTDLETIITLTATNMSYEYAHLQCESELSESQIISQLHEKYESYVFMQMIKYGIAFTTDVITEIVGEIVLELPYLYISVVEDDGFDEDIFLEERLEAYNEYLDSNFSEYEEEDEEDFDE
jgi:hypothetical protein